ncbi:MAG: hypothetical protein Ct9H90mP11_02390 [Acidimicrobiales bacterium]|nr:MAG: hypothetical protein Ct9H90mP11_02390 [Acidimicrobiales bacterium]
MSEERQAPISYIERITATYKALGYDQYQWHHRSAKPPFFKLEKPLAECKVGMIATGGVYKTGQVAFIIRMTPHTELSLPIRKRQICVQRTSHMISRVQERTLMSCSPLKALELSTKRA